MTKQMVECPKCDGSGRISAFAHIESGACFRCGGAGKVAYRARKAVAVAPVALPPAAERMPALFRKLELLVANSHRGEIQSYCSYSMGVVEGVKATLAEMSRADFDAWSAKVRATLGWQNAHLIA